MPSSLTFSLPFLFPSSLSLAPCHSERGNGNGRERKHSGTTLPLPVCPPLCHFLFEVCSFWTNQTSARVPVSFMASYIWCYEMLHRHLPCFIHVIASNLRTLYQDVKKNLTFGPKTTSSTEASTLSPFNNSGYYTFQGVIHTTNCSQTWLMINIFI